MAPYERYGDAAAERHYASWRPWRLRRPDSTTTGWPAGLPDGRWLDPSAPPDNPAGGRTESSWSTGHYCLVARIVSDAADVLGRPEEAAPTGTRRPRGAAFRRESSASGRLASAHDSVRHGGQVDLLAETTRGRAGARRASASRRPARIGPGPRKAAVSCLVDAGHRDDAYLLLQEECPSWLYQVRMGATTVWERWDSMLPDGTINPGEMTSFNHYAFGAVGDFLQRRVAGLAVGTPGGRHHHIEPRPGGGLTDAEATLDTPYGRVEVAWHREGPAQLSVDAPEGEGHSGHAGR